MIPRSAETKVCSKLSWLMIYYLGLCNVLLTRELIFLLKVEQQVWAKTMLDDLLTNNSVV